MSNNKKNNRQFNNVKSERVILNADGSRKKDPRSSGGMSKNDRPVRRTSEYYDSRYSSAGRQQSTSRPQNAREYQGTNRQQSQYRQERTNRPQSQYRQERTNGLQSQYRQERTNGLQSQYRQQSNYGSYHTNNGNGGKRTAAVKSPWYVRAVKAIGNFFIDAFNLIKKTKIKRTKVVKSSTVSLAKNSLARPLTIFFFSIVTFYIVIYGINFLSQTVINYDVLSYGTIDTPKSAEAVIIRSEKVYNTPEGGVISYEVADREKVKNGAVVCSIKDEAVVAQMQAGLDEINEQIMSKQAERGTMSVYSEDVEKYNNQIKSVFDEKAMDYAYMKLGNIYELKNTVQNQLDSRNQYLLSENSGDLKDLVAQKKEQESKISENIVNIPTDESGIVSYYIDGLESDYTPENMENLKKNQIMSTNKTENSFKGSVKANSPVFKLVTSNVWYIATYIDKSYIEGWEKGDTRYIYIKDENGEKHSLDAYVYELVSNSDKECFVIFKLTKDMIDFINVRNITVETESTERGYKIPNSAIVEETLLRIPNGYIDDEGNVLKVTESGTTKVQATLSGVDKSDDNYCYTPVKLGELNVGDTIKDPNSEKTFNIADVLNTKGIYISNTGIASFKTINLEGSVSNSTHTIISPQLNTNIYIYDRVIIDPRDIEKEEILYK